MQLHMILEFTVPSGYRWDSLTVYHGKWAWLSFYFLGKSYTCMDNCPWLCWVTRGQLLIQQKMYVEKIIRTWFKEVVFNRFVWTKSEGLQIRCLTHKNMLVWQYDRMTRKNMGFTQPKKTLAFYCCYSVVK